MAQEPDTPQEPTLQQLNDRIVEANGKIDAFTSVLGEFIEKFGSNQEPDKQHEPEPEPDTPEIDDDAIEDILK